MNLERSFLFSVYDDNKDKANTDDSQVSHTRGKYKIHILFYINSNLHKIM